MVKRDKFGPLARKSAQLDHERALKDFNRFNEVFVEAYNAERNVKLLPEKEN